MAPPRNRRRKAGSMRIDAALAAMRPMGFPDRVVRKFVKDLLKVYEDGDGDEGWYFIEEGSYKLLIETILEAEPQPEKIGSGENCSKSCSSKDETEQAQPTAVTPLPEFAPMPSPVIMDRLPTNQIRKPCYGWISEGEDDDYGDDDFLLLLPPANGANEN